MEKQRKSKIEEKIEKKSNSNVTKPYSNEEKLNKIKKKKNRILNKRKKI